MAKSPRVIVVSLADRLQAVTTRAGVEPGGLTFTESQIGEALDAIMGHTPTIVYVERLLAATPRGVALIRRIKDDPAIEVLEVRVIAHDGPYTRQIARPGS